MHNAYQSQNTRYVPNPTKHLVLLDADHSTSAIISTGVVMEPPAPFEPVSVETLPQEIGLIHDFFYAKLHQNNDAPLTEDDDLPIKQRFPKPRLPPTGKISSPRKRPIREQQQMAKKKRKLEEGREEVNGVVTSKAPPVFPKLGNGAANGKLRLDVPEGREGVVEEPSKDDGEAPGMMSPESM